MNFDKQYVLETVKDIMAVDSPSGMTRKAMERIGGYAAGLGYALQLTNKGNGIIDVQGKNEKTVAVCAHVDTLGLMVRSIKRDGGLSVTKIGSPVMPTLDGEYCRVITRNGSLFTGTILSQSNAAHVHEDANTLERNERNIYVRLDNKVRTKKDVESLGIGTGDFVCPDTKTVVTDTGFIKSRFLDDKLSVAIIFGVLKYFRDNGLTPESNLKIVFSANEEVGHGMAHLPPDVSEVLAVDMGCIGMDLNCTEYDVSICVKDSGGPYDFELTNRLIGLAKENRLSYAVDVYPNYRSDIGAILQAGHDIKGALIGAGIHASHGMERCHYDGVLNAMKLLTLYLTHAVCL